MRLKLLHDFLTTPLRKAQLSDNGQKKIPFPEPRNTGKKKPAHAGFLILNIIKRKRSGFLDLSGTDTGRTNLSAFHRTISFKNFHGLDIGMKNTFVVFYNMHPNSAFLLGKAASRYRTADSPAFSAYFTNIAHNKKLQCH